MIGSYAGITFNEFVLNLTPVVIAVMVGQILYNKFYYGHECQPGYGGRRAQNDQFPEGKTTDQR